MNLTSPSQVKAWCIAHDFHPNKVLGQNFLIDRNALEAIVDAGLAGIPDPAGARVLEIGPGLGVLTEEMLRRGCSVVAVEKDPVLAARLAESLGNPPGLTVIAGDALEVIAHPERFPGAADAARPFSCMVSNLPYQAGTRILLDLVRARTLPALTVLVQTEVAERLAAAARLRGQNRAQGGGKLLLAAPRGGLQRRPADASRQKYCIFGGRTRSFLPFDEESIRTSPQTAWQHFQRFDTIYRKGRRALERRLDNPSERIAES